MGVPEIAINKPFLKNRDLQDCKTIELGYNLVTKRGNKNISTNFKKGLPLGMPG